MMSTFIITVAHRSIKKAITKGKKYTSLQKKEINVGYHIIIIFFHVLVQINKLKEENYCTHVSLSLACNFMSILCMMT